MQPSNLYLNDSFHFMSLLLHDHMCEGTQEVIFVLRSIRHILLGTKQPHAPMDLMGLNDTMLEAGISQTTVDHCVKGLSSYIDEFKTFDFSTLEQLEISIMANEAVTKK